MPGYRRFVTYLFRYEKGRKGGNCGFAKVEVRQDKCRIEIQTKGYQDQELPVYLFAGKGEKPEGVYLGGLMIKNGMGNAVFLTPAETIGDTPYGIDDMRGLYLKEDSDCFIASQWDDAQVDWAAFAPYEESADQRKNGVENVVKESSAGVEAIGEMAGIDNAVDGLAGSGDIADEGSKKGMITKAEGEETPKTVEEQKAQQCPTSAERTEKQDSESELHATQAASAAAQPCPNAAEQSCPNAAEQPCPNAAEQPRSNAAEQSDSNTASAQPYLNAGAWEQHWQRFTAAHPAFHPFDEDEGVYGVKMNLRDFRILPKQYWCLANNSFLLHGYFNYRYVLFGYMGGEHKKWFLGVPGTFQNQEQILAGAFGFPEFRTKQLTRQKTGEFGYWYRYLDLGE